MQDETLSRAVVAYVWGIPPLPWPSARPGAVRELLGEQAPDVIPRIKKLVDEAFEVRPEGWDLVEIGDHVKVVLHRTHPELSDEAVRAICGLYTYSWK
ncbi:hypothetical protein ACNTMW_18115 [Planosporangium sp. 12N6]|uniref:hypothetical protein n=1 Tax=Planosporangium spinosum TaxID=3402278 RepID=UPI003CEA7A52